MSEPATPDPRFPRLTARPFPAYRFVAGLNAPPRSDPHGHSYRGDAEERVSFDELRAATADWRRSPHFCFGVDLYNYAYWWEAHEAWELLWRCYPIGHPLRHVLQGFIQVSAAHVQRHVGRVAGAAALVQRAGKNFEAAGRVGDLHLGVHVSAWWREHVVPYFAGPETTAYPFLVPGQAQ